MFFSVVHTGSAHTVLGPYWRAHLQKRVLKARQCSPRGGDLLVTVEEERVILAGDAVIVIFLSQSGFLQVC